MKTIKILTFCLLYFAFLFTACEKDSIETPFQNDLIVNADHQLRDGKSITADPSDLTPLDNTNNSLNPDNNECDADELDLRILFVGNSFTGDYTVEIAEMFEDLAVHNGQSISRVVACVQLGYTLQDHLNTNTCNQISQGNWDYIILQENSGMLAATTTPSGQNTAFRNAVQNYVNIIGSTTKIILYQPVPPVAHTANDFPILQNLFNTLFENTASAFQNVFVANIGESFQHAYNGAWTYSVTNPDELRYDQDFQYHFSNPGGFLTAVHFYSMIFGNKPCIPQTMHFYGNDNGNVNLYVPQFHALTQIGYIHVPYIIHGFPSSLDCQTNFSIFGYPDCN